MILRLFIVFLLISWPPSLANAAVMRTIEVQLSFDASAIPYKVVRGYKLYQDATEVCVTYDAAASSLVCDVPAYEGTHIYELSVHYTDGTESPKSPPFEFAIRSSEPSYNIPSQPKAVLSSSATAGSAPLSVKFDGSLSTTTNGQIKSYIWDFGDGSRGSGATTSHTFTHAGTYNATLAVNDSAGKTDSATIPIIVSTGAGISLPPIAVFSAAPSQGNIPLAVLFDGSASSAQDGKIISYAWSFGDGRTGLGKTVSYTYPASATYDVSLQVTDDKGNRSSTVTKTITVGKQNHDIALNYEIGELTLTSDWIRVPFATTFSRPVVFVSPPTYNGHQPVITRVRNLNSTGFDIRLQEWDYLNDYHVPEKIHYLAIEKGNVVLPDGSAIEVGEFTGKTTRQTIPFNRSFSQTPLVLTSIITRNGSDAVTGRVIKVANSGFQYILQEQESTADKHVHETVAYLALPQGRFTIDDLQIITSIAPEKISSRLSAIEFDKTFSSVPFFFAEQQTRNGSNTAALRIKRLDTKGALLFLQEDQSKDNEIIHIGETIGMILISPSLP